MYTPFKFFAIFILTCSSSALAIAQSPTSEHTTVAPPTPQSDFAPAKAQKETTEIVNNEVGTQTKAPAQIIKPQHKGELVEGKAVNPYTYSPDEIPADPNNPAETDLRAALTAMGPVAIEGYQHVQTLFNPFF